MKLFHSTHGLLCLLFCATTIGVSAQNKEVELNKEAVKLIDFNFNRNSAFSKVNKPQTAASEKKWMEFKVDLAMPRDWLDTLKLPRHDKYLTIEPYSIWTKPGEDPIFDVLINGNPNKKQYWYLSEESLRRGAYASTNRTVMTAMYDAINRSQGVGVSFAFDADKLLYENLTKRGRAIKHNRKHANAWKTYAQYIPTKADAEKFPHYGKRITAADSALIVANAQARKREERDTLPRPHVREKVIVHKKEERAVVSGNSLSDWYKELETAKRKDSINRAEQKRKKKATTNVYDYERAVKKLKEQNN